MEIIQKFITDLWLSKKHRYFKGLIKIFDPDKAIKTESQDELCRGKFSRLLGKAILEYESEESLVIGLLGKWGYGKTSIINLAIEYTKKPENFSNTPIIIEFNPWLFSNQNQLVKKFFDELQIKVEDEEFKKELKSYVDKLIPPIIGLASIIDPARSQAILKSAEYVDNKISEEESLVSLKKKLDNILIKKNQKIIVFIDDIDRLCDFEIRQIFQLVKLLADFPNIVYLLSFDRKVVINALDGVQIGSAEEYLEKIVQVSFDVPKIDESDLERLFFENINKIIDESHKNFDEKYFLNLYLHGIKHFFKSIRDVKRYTNAIKFNLTVMKDEINIADFLAITCIQVFEPEVYYGIRDNEDLFVGLLGYSVIRATVNPEEKRDKDRCYAIANKVKKNSNENVMNLIYQLFPKIYGLYHATNYGNDWLKGWRKELRICSPEHFNKYFRFSIPKSDISLPKFESTLSLGSNQKSFEHALMILIDTGKINQFIRKFIDYTEDVPVSNIKNIIFTFLKLGKKFPHSSGFGQRNVNLVTKIITSLLKNVNDQKERFFIIKESISESDSFFYILDLIYDFQYIFDHTELSEHEDPLINETQFNEIKKIMGKKIELMAESGKLLKSKNLSTFLVFWQGFDEKSVEKFVDKLLCDDFGLIGFLTGFLKEYTSHSSGEPLPRKCVKMNFESMSKFIDPDVILPRVKVILNFPIYQILNNRNKIAIELFLKKDKRIELKDSYEI